MWNRCSNRRKCLFGILAIVLIAAIIIGIIFLCRTQPLIELCPGTGSPSYRVAGYCDAFISDGTVIEGMISDTQITELLTSASVKRGVSYRAMPSPCFELRMSYPDGNFYIIVIGANGSISVAPISNLDDQTFWTDSSGQLFETLYRLHLEAGGTAFE